jgi:hypothetical protein
MIAITLVLSLRDGLGQHAKQVRSIRRRSRQARLCDRRASVSQYASTSASVQFLRTTLRFGPAGPLTASRMPAHAAHGFPLSSRPCGFGRG